MIPTVITVTSLSDAWFQLVYNLMRGRAAHSVYEITSGSYVGQKRLEYNFVLATIDQPGIRPLIPEMPPQLNIPPPVESMDYVNDYFAKYLMGTELESNETYIYGTWLAPGVQRVIEQLRNSPGNNQAAISIGGWAPEDPGGPWLAEVSTIVGKSPNRGEHKVGERCIDTDNYVDPGTGQRDPACLRVVDFRLDRDNKLHMFVYFRSWDLWGGFPANLAGLQLVKEYIGQELGAEDGKIICASKGLHLYDYCIDAAAQRTSMQGVDSMDSFLDHIEKRID